MLENIRGYLEKFKSIRPSGESLKREFIACVKEQTGIEILPAHVLVKRETLYLSCGPTIKNEIALRKDTLLRALREKSTWQRPITDIR